MSITVQEISKSYSDVQALKKTSFRIETGEFVSLLGPSGCGKTTLLRLLAGLETPDSGQIYFGDKLMFSSQEKKEVPTVKRGIGMVFQDFALWPHLTVFENVAFGLRAQRKTSDLREKVAWALEKVRLNGLENRYPDQLSGGQQQRVSFARAIVTRPQLILLDEPLSALDAVLREELKLELVQLVRELQLTTIYVTHDQSEAMSMSDRIFVLKEGQILQEGSPEMLYNQPQDAFVATFIGKSNFISDKSSKHKKMFRPERLRLHKEKENDLIYTGTVKNVSYVGDRYEVLIKQKDNQWLAYFPTRPQLNERITLYLAPEDIHIIVDE